MTTSTTVELVNKYGFLLVFASIALLLLIWLVKLLINRLVKENENKDKLIGNHLDHLTKSFNATVERIDSMSKDNRVALDKICLGFDAGFDKVVATYQIGIDRQAVLLEKVVDKLLDDKAVKSKVEVKAEDKKVEEPKV